jgi:putative hydrolase of the HAD superfamily
LLRLVVFDGDDTLWRTMPLYTAAKVEFGRALHRHLGVYSGKAIKTLESRDRVNFEQFGVSRQRFPRSMHEAYVTLARDTGRSVDPIVGKRVISIGRNVFARRSLRVVGIKRLLKSVREAGIVLILCSKGNAKIQRRRIEENGLSHLFNRIYIVPDKGEEEFRRILRKFRVQPSEACSVGNSVRCDINPALLIGMRAVWIPNETWILEKEDPLKTKRLTVAKNSRQIAQALGVTQQHRGRLGGHRH